MPVTPRFRISQESDVVVVQVHVPHVRVSNLEVVVDGAHFSLYCKPYLLRLELPGPCRDDDMAPAKAIYDADKVWSF
jgi:protein SHQ1